MSRVWQGRKRRVRAVAVIFLMLVAQARGAGLREFQDSWLLSPVDAWILTGGSPHPLTVIYEGAASVAVVAGQGRLFSLPELTQTQFQAMARDQFHTLPWQLEGSWQRLGRGLYQESQVQLKATLGRFPWMGLQVRKTTESLDSRMIWSGFGGDLVLGCLFKVGGEALLSADLVMPVMDSDPHLGQPSLREFLNVRLLWSWTGLALRLDRRLDGAPVLGFDCFWAGVKGLGVSLRIDPATGSLGPGLCLRRGPMLLRTSHLAHPALGQTHRFSLSLIRAHD